MDAILFDVMIVERESKIIDIVAGVRLPLSGSFHTVDKRLETVSGRLNEHYFCCPVFSSLQLKDGYKLPDGASDEAYAELGRQEDAQ